MLRQSRAKTKTASSDGPQALRAPLADLLRIGKFLQARYRVNHDDRSLECLNIIRESARDMERFIGTVHVLIALEDVLIRYGARAVVPDAKSDEATFYLKVPIENGDEVV